MRTVRSLPAHWREYVIEAWALGMFMLSAALATALVEYPGSGLHEAIGSEALRRVLIGVAMGATAIALIHSPWGKRSGAHMNPAVTLTFLALRRMRAADAVGYVGAQFAGGLTGAALAFALLGERFAAPPVSFVLTRPARGVALAFALEWLISCVLMSVVLALSVRPAAARYTGLAAGVLVATFIAFEAPYSGMSMNPARSFASAAVAGEWGDLWIYFVAPPLGMLTAALLHTLRRAARTGCAKLVHDDRQRCIHCGHEPQPAHDRLPSGGLTHGR